MKIKKATRKFESWLRDRIDIVETDLVLKHKMMQASPFPFLRATFYRWIEIWPEVCAREADAPEIIAVGDLHVENFGTWRDIEGRLVWGINDFDEAYPMPYTVDLVRLATSAHMAVAESHLALDPRDACDSILTGYLDGIAKGGRPFILAEEHDWLRRIATGELRDPVRFWKKLQGMRTVTKAPASARKLLQRLMPEGGLNCRFVQRQAGVGSLGRERIVAMALWRGGRVAREAKAFVPSACVWARKRKASKRLYGQMLLQKSARCRDPFVEIGDGWILRRLAPDCSRIELNLLPKVRDEARLLRAMGFETANAHFASPKAMVDVQRDLRRRPKHWLHEAAAAMLKATTRDFNDWKSEAIPA